MKKRIVSLIILLALFISLLPAVIPSAMAYGDMGKAGKTNTITRGSLHSAAIDKDGKLYTWGGNACGQLGHGDLDNRNVPTVVQDLSNVISVCAGHDYTMALTANGRLYTWGYNFCGQLGLGDESNRNKPTRVTAITNVVAISVGEKHSAAINGNGELYTWGDNQAGELGITEHDNVKIYKVSTPTKVESLSNVIAVALGSDTTAAITANGDLYMWGDNLYRQLGVGSTADSVRVPTKVNSLSNVVAVSLGFAFSSAVTANGDLYTWGFNPFGQLGLGDYDDRATPTKVVSLPNVVSVYMSAFHSAALTADGSLYTWGDNLYSQLGHGDYYDCPIPVKVNIANVVAVGLGFDNTAVLTADGKIYNWGSNDNGQLGLGRYDDEPHPNPAPVPTLPETKLPGDTPFVAIIGRVSSYNPQRKTIITLYEAGTNTVAATKTIEATSGIGTITQDFRLDGIPEGAYDLVISKQTHLNFKITDIIIGSGDLNLTTNSNKNISTILLPCGDVNSDGYINSSDLANLILPENYSKPVSEARNPLTDLVGTGFVEPSSLSVIILPANYDKTPPIYKFAS